MTLEQQAQYEVVKSVQVSFWPFGQIWMLPVLELLLKENKISIMEFLNLRKSIQEVW